MNYKGLHYIDTTIIIASVLLAIGVGIYFAKRQNSTEAYFAASGNIPAWAVGMSMFATIISSVTFLAYPGSAYAGNWILLVQGLMVPIVSVGIIGFIVPLYRRVIRLSTYEYFERRFGAFARFYSSMAFVLEHFSKMGTILYLLAMAMATFSGGVDIIWFIVCIGVAVIILTFFGGIEAIIWMDVIQGFLLIAGGIMAITVLFSLTDGGAQTILSIANQYHKIDFGPYAWDFTQLTFIVMVFNGAFYAVQKYGTDQSIVQRYLTARTDKSAKRASYLGIMLSVPTWALFMFVGTCLFAYYHINAGDLPAGIKSDEIFPHFIATKMPIGITGLIISALIAGAISSLDADVNCISAVIVEDYYGRLRPKATDRQKLLAGRIAVMATGITAILIALLYAAWGNEGVLGTLFGLYAILSSGIAGIFLLGLFSRRANRQGLYIGISAAILFTAYAVLTTTKFGTGADSELILDLKEYNFGHHTYMLGVYSHLIVIIVGYTASLLFKTPRADKELTIYAYLEEKKNNRNKTTI